MTVLTRRRAALAAIFLATSAAGIAAISAPASAARTPLARATLVDVAGNEVGEVVFKGFGTYADRVEVEIDAATSAPGAFHGFHIHTAGVCDPNGAFASAGGHWNPGGATHGNHAGDLPSVLLTEDGQSVAEFETDRFDVESLFDTDGSAVVLHAGPDNFANIPVNPYGGPVGATLNTGDAGGRYACGVVTR